MRVFPEFITETERIHLRDMALEYLQKGILGSNPLGPNRYRRRVYDTEYCDDVMTSIAHRVVATLKLEGLEVDPSLGWVISLIKPGGAIHPHTDQDEKYDSGELKHLRCNVMVQAPNKSAFPVVNRVIYPVRECGAWAFFPSETWHRTQQITGDNRIVYQYGFAVPRDHSVVKLLTKNPESDATFAALCDQLKAQLQQA